VLQERLTSLIEPLVESLGYELVLLELAPSGRTATLRLYIDGEDGVRLADCETVSREVAALLDVEDPIKQMYRLEVSSPGLDRPLTRRAHFDRFAGNRARIELSVPQAGGQRKFQGVILSTGESALRLMTDKGEVELEFSTIGRARLVPDYSSKTAEGEE